jgi:hypothetical protein
LKGKQDLAMLSFDSLSYVQTLERAGVDRKVAEAHASVMRDVVMQEVVTHASLRGQLATLERRILVSTVIMLLVTIAFLSAMIARF